MDVIAETQGPAVEWTPVAQTMMEQLIEAEEAAVRSSVAEIIHHMAPARVRLIDSKRPGEQPLLRYSRDAVAIDVF